MTKTSKTEASLTRYQPFYNTERITTPAIASQLQPANSSNDQAITELQMYPAIGFGIPRAIALLIQLLSITALILHAAEPLCLGLTYTMHTEAVTFNWRLSDYSQNEHHFGSATQYPFTASAGLVNGSSAEFDFSSVEQLVDSASVSGPGPLFAQQDSHYLIETHGLLDNDYSIIFSGFYRINGFVAAGDVVNIVLNFYGFGQGPAGAGGMSVSFSESINEVGDFERIVNIPYAVVNLTTEDNPGLFSWSLRVDAVNAISRSEGANLRALSLVESSAQTGSFVQFDQRNAAVYTVPEIPTFWMLGFGAILVANYLRRKRCSRV